MSQPPLVTLIAGPTASGKSALALELAQKTDAVIINADSQQLYADLRILTARPSVEEEALADHRLYGVADAEEAWSVGQWTRAVLPILDELRAQNRPAVLVGGTGLYFMALTRGLAEIPPVPAEVRNRVEAQYAEEGEVAFRQRLAQHDPGAAEHIERGDRQRLVRAMSVLEASGKALSLWKEETRPLLPEGTWAGYVRDIDRKQLYDRCDARAELMMQNGALNEVQFLMHRDLSPDLPAMKAVGLREISAFLAGDLSQEQALDALKQATRNYAKRQLTWFRNQTSDWLRR